MTSLLMGVLERGTAKNINYLDFQVAGKLAPQIIIRMHGSLVITLKSLLVFM